jgi:catechol 2,3-dioxygenase-like lactoylglutathione lyase family enzyme
VVQRADDAAGAEPGSALTGISHLDLSVSDRHVSARWYAAVLGFRIRGDRYNERAGLEWTHVEHPCGLSIGLVQHPDNPGSAFDERRVGLDHVSFAVASRQEVERIAAHAARHGSTVSVTETEEVVVCVLRDPDRIQVEVCARKD